MKKLFFLLLLLGSFTLYGQNGKLLAQRSFVLADSTIASLEKWWPDVRQISESVLASEITYVSDGLKIKGYLVVPKKPGKYPCLIYNRGGNRDFSELNEKYVASRLAEYASWGYVVVASQYRGNGGSEGKEEFGGSDINDVLNLIPLLASNNQADTSRIGMYGWSRGGLMTYLALTKTRKIRAAVVGGGVSNAFRSIDKRPEMEKYVYQVLIPDYQRTKKAALKARSAVFWADKLCKTTPILLLHGSADWRVSPEDGLEMATKLYEAHHPFRFVFFEGGDHALTEYTLEVNRLSKNWLDTYVRDKHVWPNLVPHGN